MILITSITLRKRISESHLQLDFTSRLIRYFHLRLKLLDPRPTSKNMMYYPLSRVRIFKKVRRE
jgi:hypothetical protein